MHDEDVVAYRAKVIDWLIARTTKRADYSDNTLAFDTTVTGDGWVVVSTPIIGKFREWSFNYEINIEDDLIAVEFALVQDLI